MTETTIQTIDTEDFETTDGFDPEEIAQVAEETEEYVAEETEPVEAKDEMTLEQVVQDILDAKEFGDELTMYQVAKALNAALEVFEVLKDGEPYTVRPQMVYNYNKNKMVVKGETVPKATKEQTKQFVVRFVGKRV